MDKQTFDKRREKALAEAGAEGIVDIVTGSKEEGISIKTVELATRLMKEHGDAAYERLETIAKAQA